MDRNVILIVIRHLLCAFIVTLADRKPNAITKARAGTKADIKESAMSPHRASGDAQARIEVNAARENLAGVGSSSLN